MKTKKLTKEEAAYASRAATPLVCGNCVMFRFPNRCKQVKGKINRDGWCKYWEKPV